jgi:hypothetical protein
MQHVIVGLSQARQQVIVRTNIAPDDLRIWELSRNAGGILFCPFSRKIIKERDLPAALKKVSRRIGSDEPGAARD